MNVNLAAFPNALILRIKKSAGNVLIRRMNRMNKQEKVAFIKKAIEDANAKALYKWTKEEITDYIIRNLNNKIDSIIYKKLGIDFRSYYNPIDNNSPLSKVFDKFAEGELQNVVNLLIKPTLTNEQKNKLQKEYEKSYFNYIKERVKLIGEQNAENEINEVLDLFKENE
jgi:hypothetical protein